MNETPGGQNEDQEGKGVGEVCEDPIIGEGSRSIHSGRGVPGGQGTSPLVVRCKESALQCRCLICGQSTKISRAVEHLSSHAWCSRAGTPQGESVWATKKDPMLQ